MFQLSLDTKSRSALSGSSMSHDSTYTQDPVEMLKNAVREGKKQLSLHEKAVMYNRTVEVEFHMKEYKKQEAKIKFLQEQAVQWKKGQDLIAKSEMFLKDYVASKKKQTQDFNDALFTSDGITDILENTIMEMFVEGFILTAYAVSKKLNMTSSDVLPTLELLEAKNAIRRIETAIGDGWVVGKLPCKKPVIHLNKLEEKLVQYFKEPTDDLREELYATPNKNLSSAIERLLSMRIIKSTDFTLGSIRYIPGDMF